jgi:hypothetical protein
MKDLLFIAELSQGKIQLLLAAIHARLIGITVSTKIHGGPALLPVPLLEGAHSWRPKARELTLIGVLHNYAGGEGSGRCDLYCNGSLDKRYVFWLLLTCSGCSA